MPHIDFSYTSDLTIDTQAVLKSVADTIKSTDPKSGICKGRAHCVEDFLSTHILLEVQVLEKPHRDAAFMDQLAENLKQSISPHLKAPCEIGLAVRYLPPAYISASYSP